MAPSFYGYVPDSGLGRTAIFVVMVLLSASVLLIRSFGAALLIKLGWAYFGCAFAAEMGLYFVYKLAMRDTYYWLPLEGTFMVIVSFTMRFIVKFITDYTGLVQFR
jgi:hypothetical protein